MSASVDIRRGAVYLSAEARDVYFRGIDAVVLIIEDRQLMILPVRQMASGGCLLKVRNAAGDCVASAPDVFHFNDLGDLEAEGLPAVWSADRGALVVPLDETNCKLNFH